MCVDLEKRDFILYVLNWLCFIRFIMEAIGNEKSI